MKDVDALYAKIQAQNAQDQACHNVVETQVFFIHLFTYVLYQNGEFEMARNDGKTFFLKIKNGVIMMVNYYIFHYLRI